MAPFFRLDLGASTWGLDLGAPTWGLDHTQDGIWPCGAEEAVANSPLAGLRNGPSYFLDRLLFFGPLVIFWTGPKNSASYNRHSTQLTISVT